MVNWGRVHHGFDNGDEALVEAMGKRDGVDIAIARPSVHWEVVYIGDPIAV